MNVPRNSTRKSHKRRSTRSFRKRITGVGSDQKAFPKHRWHTKKNLSARPGVGGRRGRGSRPLKINMSKDRYTTQEREETFLLGQGHRSGEFIEGLVAQTGKVLSGGRFIRITRESMSEKKSRIGGAGERKSIGTQVT